MIIKIPHSRIYSLRDKQHQPNNRNCNIKAIWKNSFWKLQKFIFKKLKISCRSKWNCLRWGWHNRQRWLVGLECQLKHLLFVTRPGIGVFLKVQNMTEQHMKSPHLKTVSHMNIKQQVVIKYDSNCKWFLKTYFLRSTCSTHKCVLDPFRKPWRRSDSKLWAQIKKLDLKAIAYRGPRFGVAY